MAHEAKASAHDEVGEESAHEEVEELAREVGEELAHEVGEEVVAIEEASAHGKPLQGLCSLLVGLH